MKWREEGGEGGREGEREGAREGKGSEGKGDFDLKSGGSSPDGYCDFFWKGEERERKGGE